MTHGASVTGDIIMRHSMDGNMKRSKFMKDLVVRILLILVCLYLIGCAGMPTTRWSCAYNSCIPKEQATNRCLAQANSAFSRDKTTIWEQCMRGEGFIETPCREYERGSSECRFIHVW